MVPSFFLKDGNGLKSRIERFDRSPTVVAVYTSVATLSVVSNNNDDDVANFVLSLNNRPPRIGQSEAIEL